MNRLLRSALFVLALSTVPAFAADDIYAPAMADMHTKMMALKPSGDADIDFLQDMIAHHEGAIAMAQLAVKNAKDMDVRRLAAGMVSAQQREVTYMHLLLAKHQSKGYKPSAARPPALQPPVFAPAAKVPATAK